MAAIEFNENELALRRELETSQREAMRRIHREVSGPRCKCAMCVPLPLAQAYAEATFARVEASKLRRKLKAAEELLAKKKTCSCG